MKGVFLDLASVHNGDLDLNPLISSLDEWNMQTETPPAQIAKLLQDTDVVVSNKVPLTRQQLNQAGKLKLICVAATGTNNIDLEAARDRGIVVTNVRAYCTTSVVQHVFGLLLSLVRHLPDYQQAVRDNRWQQSPHFCLLDYPIEELTGKVLGIIGYGELGQAVAKTASCFGMQVKIASRDEADNRADRLPLNVLLAESDVVSLHCPLTDQNRGMIGQAQLKLMKPGAILLNTARGGLVDEAALAAALQEGQIAAAGIDVLEQEPPDGQSPLFGKVPNLLLTPHIAWASRAARQGLLDQIAEIILDFRAGRIRNRVI